MTPASVDFSVVTTAADSLHKPEKLHSGTTNLGELQATLQLVSVNTEGRAPPSVTQPEASDWCDVIGLYTMVVVGPYARPMQGQQEAVW